MKKTVLVGITLGIAVLITMPITHVSSLPDSEDDAGINSPVITNSYYTNISGQKYWISFKITFLEPSNVTLEFTRHTLQDHRTRDYFMNYRHSEYSHGFGLHISNFISIDTHYYYQINLGTINKSFYYTKQNFRENEDREHGQYGPYGDELGPHRYFTFFSYSDCKEETLDIWINSSHNVSISKTQGTEVFVCEREDFFGNINVGCKRGTMIVNGIKKIHINNTLFAYFSTDMISTGFNLLKYISPSGHHKHLRHIRLGGFPILYRWGRVEDFEEGLLWAENGTWTFKTTLVKMSVRKSYPMTFLFGADVNLPE
jgi:hypothetical protein